MLTAYIQQGLDQAAAGRDDDGAMTGAHQRGSNFQGGALDAAGLQCRQQLHHGQAVHRPVSVGEHEQRAAIRALGFAVGLVFDRQVHARMRVPQRHFRRRAAQRQVAAVHGVTRLRIGGRGGGLAHGGAVERERMPAF